MTFVIVVLAVAVGAVVYGIYKGQTVKKIEADLKSWIRDAEAPRNSADASVKVHYEAYVNKIKSFITKYFKL